MGSYGECKVCGEKVFYAPDDLHNLGLHLLDKHPNNEFAHFTLLYDGGPEKKDCTCPCDCNCDCGKYKKGKPCNRSKAFKTTIESWKQAQNPVKCSKCNKTAVPLIRRQRHKLAKTPFGAFILLGCWPICFLPFILGGSDLMYLYCKECGNYLGMYDRRVPDREGICNQPLGDGSPQVCSCK